MFEIYGGATEFQQWSLDQKVINDCMDVGEEVVFRTAHSKVGISIARMEGDTVVADVPNEILMYAGNISVELGQGKERCDDCYTVFSVIAQEKPEGYVCTDNRNLAKKYLLTVKQELTEAEKAQVRENIGAGMGGGGKITQEQLPAGYPWEGRTVIEWDGNTEGYETVPFGEGMEYVRVAETAPPASELNGGTMLMMGIELEIGGSNIPIVEGGNYCYLGSAEEMAVVCVYADSVTVEGILFDKPGVYFVSVMGALTMKAGKLKKMSADFIPVNVLYGGADDYLYLDPAATVKATKTDLVAAQRKGIIMVDVMAYTGGMPGVVLYPCINTNVLSYEWGKVIFASGSDTDGKPIFATRYTAEYTGS